MMSRAVLLLPLLAALGQAVAFHIHNANNGSIVSAGIRHEYLVHVPARVKRPAPLVISLHGAGGWAAQQRDVSRWNDLAEAEGFIVVYPEAADNSGPRIWRPDDARFIADLIDKLEGTYDIDRDRIYANGLSNGGGLSFVLSCRLSDRIAAVGLVAAALTSPWKSCGDDRPVPMIAFHGTADPVIPYRGGVSWLSVERFPNIPIWTRKWAQRNRCTTEREFVATDVMQRAYGNCSAAADVVLYTFRGGGHTWPGGEPMPEWFAGRTSRSVDATRVMWTFFRAHPLAVR